MAIIEEHKIDTIKKAEKSGKTFFTSTDPNAKVHLYVQKGGHFSINKMNLFENRESILYNLSHNDE